MFHQTIFFSSHSVCNSAEISPSTSQRASTMVSASSSRTKQNFKDVRKQYFQNRQRIGLGSPMGFSSTFINMTTIREFEKTNFSDCTPMKMSPLGIALQFNPFLTPLASPIFPLRDQSASIGIPRSSRIFQLPLRSPMFFRQQQTPTNVSDHNFDHLELTPTSRTVSLPSDYPTKYNTENSKQSLKPKRLFASKIYNDFDAETATTASMTTSPCNPSWSFHSSLSPREEEKAERVEFVLDNEEDIPDWMSNSDSRCSEIEEDTDTMNVELCEFDAKGLENRDYEYSDDDDEDDDICSCSTPVHANSSRQLQRSIMSIEQAEAVMTTTRTETTTTTTTTTQTTTSSSMSTCGLVASKAISQTKTDNGLAMHKTIQRTSSNNNIATLKQRHDDEPSSVLAKATISTAATKDSVCPCKSCASKQRLIDQQRSELSHMKIMMKKLCLLLADTVRTQENNRIQNDESKRLALDPSPGKRRIAKGPVSSIPSSEGDSSSSTILSTSTSSSSIESTASSKFEPMLHRPRIASLPVTSVGKDCPRIKNQRIQVSGHWGTYSGPSLIGNNNQSGSTPEHETNDEDEGKDDFSAGILLGCVVRLDDASLYVGSLSRNDTGSFIYHPPGTLYDHTGKVMWRLR